MHYTKNEALKGPCGAIAKNAPMTHPAEVAPLLWKNPEGNSDLT